MGDIMKDEDIKVGQEVIVCGAEIVEVLEVFTNTVIVDSYAKDGPIIVEKKNISAVECLEVSKMLEATKKAK